MQAAQSFWSERAVPAAAVILLHAGLIYFIGMGLGVIPRLPILKTPELVPIPPIERPDPNDEVPLWSDGPGVKTDLDLQLQPPEIPIEPTEPTRNTLVQLPTGSNTAPEPKTIAPRVKSSFEPPYPRRSILEKEEGVVYVRVTVTPFGTVSDVALEKSSGSPRLDEAALKGVRQWTFTPGRRGAETVSATTVVSVRFQIR